MVDNRCRIGVYEKAIPEEYSLREMLAFAKEAGYDYFEISIDRTPQRIDRLYSPEYIAQAAQAIRETGIPIGAVCLSALGTYTLGSPDAETEAKALDIFSHALAFARELHIPIIQLPACDMGKFDPRDEDTDRRFLANLKRITRMAAGEGILLGLENMENDYMDSVSKCMRAVDEVASPYLQLYVDAGNITSAMKLQGGSIEEDMRTGDGHYIAFHLKETQPGRYGGLFYGEGHADFVNTVAHVYAQGVRRYTMEYWYTGNPDWRGDMVRARELCRGWIAAAAERN